MLAAMLTASGFEMREVPEPVPGPGEVLVSTDACGICEGDVFIYKNRAELREPLLLGHEGMGTVVEVGKGVTRFRPGQRVAALGGAYAEYFVTVPERLALVPDRMASADALGEPLACCVHAMQRSRIESGEHVAILGAGFMGQVCGQLLDFWEQGELLIVDPIEERRKHARLMFSMKSCHPDEVTGPFDVVIEATGQQSALDLAGDLLREHGRLLIVGYHQSDGGRRTINMKQWNWKGLDVINAHVRRTDEKLEAMEYGLLAVDAGAINFWDLVDTYRFEDVEQAMEDLVARKPRLYKAVLTF